MNVEVIYYI